MLRAFVFIALICCSTSAVFAAAKNETMERVTAVKPDGTLVLSSSGNAVLANILSPAPAAAETWLAEYALQKEFVFSSLGEDRYGRSMVESALQEDMLNDGAAVYYISRGKLPVSWRAAEKRARDAKRGVWDDRAKTVLINATQTHEHFGEFHVIEGTITRIYAAKAATYLNFGDDWHTDFSITIPGKIRRSMKAQLAEVKEGNVVRVRGYIHEENGPMVTLNHADNLEMR